MFKFQHNESLDFGYSIYRLVNKKKLSQREGEDNLLNGCDICKAIDKIESDISVAWFHKMNQLVSKYYFHSFMILYSCLNPEQNESQIIEYIRNLEPQQFYIDFIKYVLALDDYDDEEKIKDKIHLVNRNNMMKEAPSFTAVKYFQRHPGQLKDELCEFLDYYLPIYLDAKSMVEEQVNEALTTYKETYPDLESFLKVNPMIDSKVFPEDMKVYGNVTAFMDTGIFIMIRDEYCFLIIGSKLTYLLTDEYKEKQKLQFFKCFSDTTKLKILECIKSDKLCAMDLVERLGLTKSTISHHIGQLLSAQIIFLSEKEGKKMFYSVNTEHMEKVFSDMLDEFK